MSLWSIFIIFSIFIITFQFTLSKAFSKSTKAIYTFLFTAELFCTIFCKHRIGVLVSVFFQKPNWSSARFSSIFFSIRPKMIFVKLLDVCVKILKVQYTSHFVSLCSLVTLPLHFLEIIRNFFLLYVINKTV